MKKKGWSALMRQKQYVIAGTLVIIAAVGTTVLYGNYQEKEREQMEAELAEEIQGQNSAGQTAQEESTEESAVVSAIIPPESNTSQTTGRKAQNDARTVNQSDMQEGILAEEAAIAAETGDTAQTEDESEQPEASEQPKETAAKAEELHFSPEDGMIWPMEGNVVLNYSMDSTIYFPTLDQYKYNPAIVIAGNVNDKVFSVAKGQVSSIESNEVTGTTMTVDLGDGYQAVYGQLKELKFDVGDYVESGHVLGFVSEPTKYFSVEGSNLYFELLKDGEPVDPVAFLE